MLVAKGAQENSHRPAINSLFRSAGVGFGSGVIGSILTGHLEDGTAGMKAMRRCGGTCLERENMSQVHIDRMRAMLKTANNESGDDMPS